MNHELRYSKPALIEQLERAGCTHIKGNTVKCPYCGDKTPSGWIKQSSDGVYRYKCHKSESCPSGDVFDLIAHNEGKPTEEVVKAHSDAPAPAPARTSSPEKDPPKHYKTIEEIQSDIESFATCDDYYVYTDPDTNNHDLVVMRILQRNGKKSFWQLHQVDDDYLRARPAGDTPIYNRTRVRAADTVLIVEGEKCVHAALTVGIVATTSAGGSNAAEFTDWSPLAGKDVIIWPDNDDNGHKYADKVREKLEALTPQPTIAVLKPEWFDLAAKGDIADFIARERDDGRTNEDIRDLIVDEYANARPRSATTSLADYYEKVINGEIKLLSWSHPRLTNIPRSLRAGACILICGDPGSNKSFFLLAELLYWHAQGIKVSILFLEETKTYYMQRLHAMLTQESRVFDPFWVQRNAEFVRRTLKEHAPLMEELEKCIYCSDEQSVDVDYVIEFIRREFQAGCDIVCVDPITSMEYKRNSWEDDKRFMKTTKAIASEHGGCLIYVTHPRGNSKHNIDLESLAGGQAFQRFSTAVWWIEGHNDEEHESEIITSNGPISVDHNRTLHMAKVRDGPGHGQAIAYNFDSISLTFKEQGLIKKRKKKTKKDQPNAPENHHQSAEARADQRFEDTTESLQSTFPGDAGYPDTGRFD